MEDNNIQVNGADGMIADPECVFHETPCGKGLGNALKVARDRGWLKENHDESSDDGETSARRRKNNIRKNKGRYDFEDVQIVRRDQQGRELTTKEAYREFCHAFHGKKPSTKTIEKRERRLEMKTQKPTGNQDLLALERNLKVAQSPYVVISTGERKKEITGIHKVQVVSRYRNLNPTGLIIGLGKNKFST